MHRHALLLRCHDGQLRGVRRRYPDPAPRTPDWQIKAHVRSPATHASGPRLGTVVEYALQQSLVLLAVVALLGCVYILLLRLPGLLVRVSGKLAQLMIAFQHFGLQPKVLKRAFEPWTPPLPGATRTHISRVDDS